MSGVIKAIGSIFAFALGTAFGGPILGSLFAMATSVATSALKPKPKAPKVSPENFDRLRATIDPRAPRKTMIGTTRMGVTIR